MEILGLHETFFEEVKELRDYAYRKSFGITEDGRFDFDHPTWKDPFSEESRELGKKADRISNLAKVDLSLRWEETEEYRETIRQQNEDFLQSDEYQSAMQQGYEDDLKEVAEFDRFIAEANLAEKRAFYSLLERGVVFRHAKAMIESGSEQDITDLPWQPPMDNPRSWITGLPEPVRGIPVNGRRMPGSSDNPVFFHENCLVTEINLSSWDNGWHEIHFENETQRFILTTKFRWIIDSYAVGKRGIWTVGYGDEKYYLDVYRAPEDQVGSFFYSSQWLQIRYKKLKDAGKCALCGSTERLELDHIKPRNLYPALELDPTNLQVLCFKCNQGKGDADTTDFRKA